MILKITGDWQKFKGEPGAEGTLRVAAPTADKKAVFEAAAKESLGDSRRPRRDHARAEEGRPRRRGRGRAGRGRRGCAEPTAAPRRPSLPREAEPAAAKPACCASRDRPTPTPTAADAADDAPGGRDAAQVEGAGDAQAEG